MEESSLCTVCTSFFNVIHCDCCIRLIDNGNDVNETNSIRSTPLFLVKNVDIAKILII